MAAAHDRRREGRYPRYRREGTFGTVIRPDGTRQLTFNKWPLYTFTSDKKPLQVLCNGVDG